MLFSLLMLLIGAPPSVEWTGLPSARIAAVENAGDVSGDGTDDIFAASLEAHGHGVFCVEGLTGQIIWHNTDVTGVSETGCLRAIADLDFDGVRDLAVGRASPPSVTVLSGATGEVLWSVSQNYPVRYVQTAQGPEPGDVMVFVSAASSSSDHIFRGLNGLTGQEVWSSPLVSTLDSFIKVTEHDVNGNGWPEMGYSVDRGSVFNGYVVVRDGGTGVTIHSAMTMFFGTMDIGGNPPIIAVSHFGVYPSMWVTLLACGTDLWSSDSDFLIFNNLKVIPPVSGYYPDVLGLHGALLTLIRGDDGHHQDRYSFSGTIKGVATYQEGSQWKLAVLTPSRFHCPQLVFASPSTDPQISLPNTGGSDLCLLESDQYPTPLAAVAMVDSGAGLCVISTSWPVGVTGDDSERVPYLPPVTLLSQPGRGGLLLSRGTADEVTVLDLSGRVAATMEFHGEQTVFLPLPPGVYHIADRNTGASLRATVLAD